MIKLKKSDVGKLVIIYWQDIVSEHKTTLEEFAKKGTAEIISVGWIAQFNKVDLVICSEKGDRLKVGDYTIVPRSIIGKVEWLKEEK